MELAGKIEKVTQSLPVNLTQEEIIECVKSLAKTTKEWRDCEARNKPYVIVRTLSAGVFAGYLESRIGQEVVVLNARRIWYWDGAASLSQLAMEGTSKPEKCKFPIQVDRIELLQAIEIINCTEKSRKSIESVAIWKQ